MDQHTHIILLAQAETPADAAHDTEAAHEPAAGEAEHAPAAGEELHAGTETHGGEHSDVFPPFDPVNFSSQLIWLAITFGILYLVLSRVALPRIGGIIEDRKSRIDADLATADASRQRTDAAIAAYETALTQARRKSQTLAEQTRAEIKTDIDRRRLDVETDLSRRVSEAEARIQLTKAEALGHVDEIAADTVATVVEQLAGPVSAQEARDAVAAVVRS